MFNNLKWYFKKLKSTKLWYLFLLYLIKPIFNFLWEFIINFEGKIYYYKWFFQKKFYFSLNNSDKVVVKNDQDNINLAKELNNIIDGEFQKKYIEIFKNNQTKHKNNEFEHTKSSEKTWSEIQYLKLKKIKFFLAEHNIILRDMTINSNLKFI